MRSLKDIYDEVASECQKDNCQSVRSIALAAMERAVKEAREELEEMGE